ncbi:Eukaryotic translation initiation factor 3 subunit I [Boothiomyces sp. JEL0866]|nr:Eukaryotic translation initiation factor 3 subunit I [Boothiomyces sp. JEL0866]
MRPILLNGHTRALTTVKYNYDGDLIFSVSKDSVPCVWYSSNGERLGTFEGHNGTVWTLDISRDSTRLLTGSADNSMILWNVNGGEQLFKWDTQTAVRAVSFASGDKLALFVTDATMGQKSTIHIVEIAEDSSKRKPQLTVETSKILNKFVIKGSKATRALWGKLNKTIITGHEDGTVCVFDAQTGEVLKSVKEHSGPITDIQFGTTQDYFITSSKDHCAIIFEADTLSIYKKFETERPVNSAAISPLKPHLILGGGQDAMSVTTTSAKQGKFEVRFYHMVFEEEIGRVKGHFGPINTLAFHPSGKGYASGGEDGFVRVHHFDESYFKFQFPEERD